MKFSKAFTQATEFISNLSLSIPQTFHSSRFHCAWQTVSLALVSDGPLSRLNKDSQGQDYPAKPGVLLSLKAECMDYPYISLSNNYFHCMDRTKQ